jgi:hypothetical protein
MLSTEEWTTLIIFERHLSTLKLKKGDQTVIDYFSSVIEELKKKQ